MSTKHEDRLEILLNEEELDLIERELKKLKTVVLEQEKSSGKGISEKLIKRRDELLKDKSKIAIEPKIGDRSPSKYGGKVILSDKDDPLYSHRIKTIKDILKEIKQSGLRPIHVLGIAEADINAGLKVLSWSEGGPRDDDQYAVVQFSDSGYPDPVSSLRFNASAKSKSKDCAFDPAVYEAVVGIMKFQLPIAYRDGTCQWTCSLRTNFPEGIAHVNNACVWGELWSAQSSTDRDFPEDVNEYESQYLWHKECASNGTISEVITVTGEFPTIEGEASCIFIGLSLRVRSRGDSYVKTRLSNNYMGFPPDWPSFSVSTEDADTAERVDGLAYNIF